VGPDLNWEIDLFPYVSATTIESSHHHGARPQVRHVKRQLAQSSFGHGVEGRAIVNEHFGHYVVQTFDRHVQGFVVSPGLDGYLFVGKSEVIVGHDVIDYTPETLHEYVLCYVGLIQNLDQQRPTRHGVHKQPQQRNPSWDFV